jgi:hypothetical protein
MTTTSTSTISTSTISYEWDIIGLVTVNTYTGYTNVVTDVLWTITGTLGIPDLEPQTWTSTIQGDQIVPFDPNNFTDFNNLTKSQVIDWVQNRIGLTAIDQYRIQIADTIASLQNIYYGGGDYQRLPWSP